MKKTLLTIALLLSVSLLVPASLKAEPMIEIFDNMDIEVQGITISIENNVLHITGAEGLTLQIYKITGVGVMNTKVDSEDKYYTLDLTKGCYIVKIGKVARKISII